MADRKDIVETGDLEQRLRQATQRELPKRFYKSVSVDENDGRFRPLLDGRPIRTPGKRPLEVTTRAAADAIAAEWDAQEKIIDPATMPLTRLVNTIVDRIGPAREDVRAEIVAYAGSDLLCYRADGPQTLVERQIAAWTPPLRWLETEIGARFLLAEGVMPIEQPRGVLDGVAAVVADFDDAALGSVASMTNLTGSAVLALAVARQAIDHCAAWAAAHIDEDFQIEQWGEDDEARARRAARGQDMEAAARLLALLREQ